MVTATPSGANSVARASENPSMANFVEPQPGVPTTTTSIRPNFATAAVTASAI
jgi:hypothetical protein